ncbi:unnamed protein product [Kuraishia capsulata CBS 1993]|uniref:1-phosphatidylinositol 4-kinase n=1 Tax=Kuraishia capsulata CBS 1993 TaxID=1382522 RepID=W6MK60_9ASCO|nr:uncharacterized protein KUCA_T00002906001 [Kuraishia capsulata CBS 1993]CDK26929.1 unnamed protein product [Kuraishia capsulata CBS 1993]
MALEELIKNLCQKDAHYSLLTFWHLQAVLHELGTDSTLNVSFRICQRMLNELQYHLFNFSTNQHTITSPQSASRGVVAPHEAMKQFHENVPPSLVLFSSVMASVALPQVNMYVEPLVKTQGKQVKSLVFEVVKNLKKDLTKNLTLKNTMSNALLGRSKANKEFVELDSSDFDDEIPQPRSKSLSLTSASTINRDRALQYSRKSEDLEFSAIERYAEERLGSLNRTISTHSLRSHSRSNPGLTRKYATVSAIYPEHPGNTEVTTAMDNEATPDDGLGRASIDDLVSSMPNLHVSSSRLSTSSTVDVGYDSPTGSFSSSARNSRDYRFSSDADSIYDHDAPLDSPNAGYNQVNLTAPQKIKMLKSNYFKCETQFAIALQSISIKLSKVPKDARLSALKAELAIMNKDLPSEVDIPLLLPKSKKGKMHRIVRIPVNEVAVLNSAERVPYLLLVEYLSDDIDFSPDSKENLRLLSELTGVASTEMTKKETNYKFDLGSMAPPVLKRSVTPSKPAVLGDLDKAVPTVDETDLGDFSVVKLSNLSGNEKVKKDRFVSSVSDVPVLSDTRKEGSPGSSGSEHIRNSELEFQSHYNVDDLGDADTDLATQMRIAAVMLTQLDSTTGHLPPDQSTAIKARIINSMRSLQNGFGIRDLEDIHAEAGERKLSNDLKVAGVGPSSQATYYLGEDWNTRKERIRRESIYGHLENWELCSIIAKTGDDLTQEAFASQLIQAMSTVWYTHNVNVWVKRMRILVTSSSTGIVETITNAVSIHSIKRALTQYMIDNNENQLGKIATLSDHFSRTFGDPEGVKYKRAQDNFTSSLAAYSIICYLLQIKDRHNGNIMLDSEGHIIHIDFGFLLSNSPGSVGFEAAPFKLTSEYVDLLGGTEGHHFKRFKQLMKDGFRSIRKNAEQILGMVELMQKDSNLACFQAGENTSVQLRQRFQLHLTDPECDQFVENVLIGKSINSIYTRLYDQFQLLTQGIYS